MSTDLATTVARDLIDPIADEIVRDPAIRLRVARRLRDEIVEIEHRVMNERRCEADEPPNFPKPA
jgi:hypothetical protein